MLTTLPIYDTAAAIADAAVAAVQAEFPALEARHVNTGPTGCLLWSRRATRSTAIAGPTSQ